MARVRDRSTPFKAARRRRAVNLSVDAALLAEARESAINLSRLLEQSLEREIKSRRAAAWQDRNRAGLDALNDLVARIGVPGSSYRGD